ncbi:hypothetical protein ABEB36_000906 [Hypothenemus hampei]|uniref:L-lactate dehydrogenase n=1 Tax=Hypothenemus hampei TaxID=57062 RepID=A0ABD1FGE6_HYPHA
MYDNYRTSGNSGSYGYRTIILIPVFIRGENVTCDSAACIKMNTKDQLLSVISETCDTSIDKVTVVGAGDVGTACIFTLLSQGVSSNVTIIDVNENKMMGELLDFQHGSLFFNGKVTGCKGNDYSATAGSKVCVITAGARQKTGESRLDLVQKNTEILKGIVPNLVKYSPDTIIIVVSNPCDILAYVTWKLSGLPKNRIIGSGTNLDTSRFRFYIAEKMKVAPESAHAWIIGEHGDTSVAVWSGVSVAGVRLRDLNPAMGTDNDPENWKEIHNKVIRSAYEVIELKGSTSWAIGLSVANITRSILKNSNKIHAISTNIKGMCGIEQEVFLSLPCVLGRNGIIAIIDPHLVEAERCSLKFSAAKMMEVANGIKF